MVEFKLLIGIGKRKSCRAKAIDSAGAARCPPDCQGSCERPLQDKFHKDAEKKTNVLKSPNASYEVISTLGRGVYGKVIKCRQVGTEQLFAVKVLKSAPRFKEAGRREARFLSRLCGCEGVVRCVEWFEESASGRTCLVLELLWRSLAEAADALAPRPLPLAHTRLVLRQLLQALHHLQSAGIVHADIKPDNIMVAGSAAPVRVKLIDFGCAVTRAEAAAGERSLYAQTRHFRAPEVLLRAGLCAQADVWSLGCVAGGLLLARTLFPGHSEYDQLRFICATQGAPPRGCAWHLPDADVYFRLQRQGAAPPALRLKAPEEMWEATGRLPQLNALDAPLRSLDEVAPLHLRALQRPARAAPDAPNARAPPAAPAPDPAALRLCVGLLKHMLLLDQDRRIQPLEALAHPFFLLPSCASGLPPPEDYGGAGANDNDSGRAPESSAPAAAVDCKAATPDRPCSTTARPSRSHFLVATDAAAEGALVLSGR